MSLVGTALSAFADTVPLTVHTGQATKKIDVGIYGQFLEHIFHSVHGGLWGDQILNGTFELAPRRRRNGESRSANSASRQLDSATTPPSGWVFEPTSGQVRNDPENPFNAANSIRLEAAGDTPAGSTVRQHDIALKQDEHYTLSIHARGTGELDIAFSAGNDILVSHTVAGLTSDWQKFTFEFTAPPRSTTPN